MAAASDSDRELVLFISHRHVDRDIANVLRSAIEDWAAGEVKVYQSSFPGSAPRVGRGLNQQLREQLAEASVVMLVFTVNDANWSYCMWECGVATDPRSEDTNIVVIRFSDDSPGPLGDLVQVDARNLDDIHKLTRDFFTDEGFFPGFDGAFRPRMRAGDEALRRKAEQLFEQLRQVAPPPEYQGWPAWPYMILQISNENHRNIKETKKQQDRLNLAEQILMQSRVVDGDKTARRMFGRQRFDPNMSFGEVIDAWKPTELEDELEQPWIKSLATQIIEATLGLVINPSWELVHGVLDLRSPEDWSFPAVLWVRGVPEGFQFDVYFIPWRKQNMEA
jgi:hypothetical protein